MNGTILANRSAVDRNKTDFYETPTDVTAALLDFLEERNMISARCWIWEPANGGGKMEQVLRDRGYSVIGTDLYPADDGIPGIDFLETAMPCDWIITNPPFSQAEKFVRHALDLRRPCAFLLKSQFWHARSRLGLFREHPPAYVLPLTWRPDFLYGAKSGSPTMEVLWTVWDRGDFITEYIPLERPGKEKAHG